MSVKNQKPISSSPISTSGLGTRIEHRIGVVFLTRLLTERSVSELGERAPTQVAFQQSPATTVDDLMITAQGAEGEPCFRLAIAVRRTPNFVRSHEDTKGLILALVRADLAVEREADPLIDHRLAIAVSGQQTQAQELAKLAVLARNQTKQEDFFGLVNTPGKFTKQDKERLIHLRDMVSEALSTIADTAAGTAEHRCWRLLGRLSIITMNIEAGHEDDWTALVDDLMPFTPDRSHAAAAALRDHLDQLSAEFASTAATVDVSLLRRRLHGRIDASAGTPPKGWSQLLALDKEARSGVSRSLAAYGSCASLTLPREVVRNELRAAMESGEDLIVTGDSGVGKSALVMDSIDKVELGRDRQALALNLRHLPSNLLELQTKLKKPLDQLLYWMNAPARILVIDGAEAAAEEHEQIFAHVVRCARDAGLQIVAVSAKESARVATDLLRNGSVSLREFEVPALNNEEIVVVAHNYPSLQRLSEDARARELLRRPIVVDLLVRSGDARVPLSESEALGYIWDRMVRNNGRRDDGLPDARERVMLHLAAHAIQGGKVDDVLVHLDDAALEGLRRSGLILPASKLPWERVPEFKHDLLRAYSIARYLLREYDCVRELLEAGAPRWTLPSARLACEIVFSAPDELLHPLAGRFARLQTSFQKVVDAGYGSRWADVPTEALLTIPESNRIIEDAWPTLINDQSNGLARVIRILHVRHQRDGLLDPTIAEPVVTRLLAEETPSGLENVAKTLIRDWLLAHVVSSTDAGQTTRVTIRDAILHQCSQREHQLEQAHIAQQATLADRTPEQVAADEERQKKFSYLTLPSCPDSLRPRPTRRQSSLWIEDAQIEQLALLGADLGATGEALLRRLADESPKRLVYAVEPVFAGHSLATFSPKLLNDLAAAYYINDDDDGRGWNCSLGESGIRPHLRSGFIQPQAAFTNGPFLELFRSDFRGSVSFLNRMLNHAARCRVRTLSNLNIGHHPFDEDESEPQRLLSITGEPLAFLGDDQVWRWYRGTGVGPYPCMSALQALEFVTEEIILAGASVTTLVSILLKGVENLAMPALVLGILVRHLESAETALDSFLVEPALWRLEFARVIHEQTGGFPAKVPNLKNPERRKWSLREVSLVLVSRAKGERIAQLKKLGDQLRMNAIAQAGGHLSPDADATVHGWAASLDQSSYELLQQDGSLYIQQVIPPDVQQHINETSEVFLRQKEVIGLTMRHSEMRDNGGRAPHLSADALAADLVLARDLLANPSRFGRVKSSYETVAVAASALELFLTGRTHVCGHDLQWSASLLLSVAKEVAEHKRNQLVEEILLQQTDRSVGQALPFLLLPAAVDIRRAVGINSSEDVERFIAMCNAVVLNASEEARLAFSRGLDAIWAAPCDMSHLYGRCHHCIALDIMQESYLVSVIGPLDPKSQRRNITRLNPPTHTTFEEVAAKDIAVQLLTPAIRAAGAAAISCHCCNEVARETLESLIAAHQRAMLAFESGLHNSDSYSLVAARAVLWQAIDGRDGPVHGYIERYLGDSRLLAEGIDAIALAGVERADAGEQARRLWPQIMDRILDAAETNRNIFTEHTWGKYVEASLIPTPSEGLGYTTVEIGEPYNWRDPLALAPQIERWITTISGSRTSIDALVTAIKELDKQHQIDAGLNWTERIVERSGTNCANTLHLPKWLHEIRADLDTDERRARWQRIVDHLLVAGDVRVADLAD